MTVTEIPESTAVTRFRYDVDQPLAANKKLQASDDAISAARQKGAKVATEAYDQLNKKLGEHRAQVEENAKKWEDAQHRFEKTSGQIGQGIAKIKEELDQTGVKLGAMFADVALSTGIDLVTEAITGLADALGLIDLPVTQATVDVVRDLAEADIWLSDAAAQLVPRLQAQVDVIDENARKHEVMTSVAQELLTYMDQDRAAAERFTDALAILDYRLEKGYDTAEEYADALRHVTDQYNEATGAAQEALDTWNRGFAGMQKVVADVDRSTARAAREGRAYQLEYAQGSSTPTDAYLTEQAARDRDAEAEQERLDEQHELRKARFPKSFLPAELAGQDYAGPDLAFAIAGDVNAPKESPLVKALGPIEEFDAYAEAFGALSGAADAAYEALVTGSTGAGAAIKAFSADLALAIGKRSVLRAAEEIALAIAEPWSAGQHLAAAAKFAGVAVLAGVVASQLGGGGSSSTSTSSSSSAPSSSSSGSSSGGQVIYQSHYYGDAFASASHRDRQRMIDREDRERIGGGGGVN